MREDNLIIKNNPAYPYIVIDNWFSNDEEKNIWKELDYYSSVPKERAENTVVAHNEGTALSKSYRYYINKFYTDIGRSKSSIFKYMYKQRTSEFNKLIEQCLPHGRSYKHTDWSSTLVSYYEEDDYYKPHYDKYMWTCLIWMIKDLNIFDGGDLKLNDIDETIKVKNNRMVMFPSCYLHEATPIKFKNKINENGYGKYTITHFYSSIGTS